MLGVCNIFKVVIVEDEEKICNMISTFIDWNKVGFEVIGTASDGITGKALIKQVHPDVVITDIRMPGCDGIEMIESVKEEFPDIDIIIISGHKNFEYAHRAIKFGIRYFLLKPIIEAELMEILAEISENHEKLFTQQSEMISMQDRINTQNDILRNNFTQDLCADKNYISHMTRSEINSKYATKFTDSKYCVLIARCNKRYNNDMSGGENILINLLPLVKRSYVDAADELVYDINDYGLVIVINYNEQQGSRIREAHQVFHNNAVQRIKALGLYLFYIGVGNQVSSIQQLQDSFTSAELAIRSRVFSNSEGFITYCGSLDYNADTRSIVSDDYYLQLLGHIKKHNESGMERWFVELNSKLNDFPALNLSQLYSICMQAFGYVADLVENSCKNQFDRAKLLQECNMALLDANSVPNVVKLLAGQINGLAQHFFNDEESGHNQHVRKAIAYIEEHYSDQLKLGDVAKHVYLNPTYFSEVFKEECGVTFTDYLLNVRIEGAKKMLRETDIGIVQIAANAGYLDAKYFSKIFTRVVGIKPTGYRKLYR